MFGYAAFASAPFASLGKLGNYYDLVRVEAIVSANAQTISNAFLNTIVENVNILDTPTNNTAIKFTRVEPISSVRDVQTTKFAYNQLVVEVLDLVARDSVVGWIKVNDSQTVTWNTINNGQTTVWSDVNNTEITNWNPVNNIQ